MLFEEYLRDIPLLHIWDGGKTLSTGGFEPEHLKTLHDFLRDRLPNHPVLLETGGDAERALEMIRITLATRSFDLKH